MASIFDKFPFSSYEGLNLDWVLQNLKQLFGEGEALYQDLREWKEDTTTEVQTWISNTNEALAAWKTQTESDFTIQITSELDSAKQELLATVSAGLLAIEGVAYGTQNGEPVEEGSPYYHNNVTYYQQQAQASAFESRAWANGANSSPLYANNNSKYFKERSEAWAVGQINGVDVPDTDDAYENNAKYYSDQIADSAAQIAANTGDIADLKIASNTTQNNLESLAENGEIAVLNKNNMFPDPTFAKGEWGTQNGTITLTDKDGSFSKIASFTRTDTSTGGYLLAMLPTSIFENGKTYRISIKNTGDSNTQILGVRQNTNGQYGSVMGWVLSDVSMTTDYHTASGSAYHYDWTVDTDDFGGYSYIQIQFKDTGSTSGHPRTFYEPFIGLASENTDYTVLLKLDYVKQELLNPTNFFNGNVYNDYLYGKTSGNKYSQEGYVCSQPQPLKAGNYIFITNKQYFGASADTCFYFESTDTSIAGIPITATFLGERTRGGVTYGLYTFVASVDGYYAFNIGRIQNDDADNFMIVSGSELTDYPPSYLDYFEPYLAPKSGYGLNAKMLITTNILYGKKVTWDGDSICYGYGADGGYGKIISGRNQMPYVNNAVSGATITYGTTFPTTGNDRHWICTSVENTPSDTEYLIVEGGANDCGNQVTIGNLVSGYPVAGASDTLDKTTLIGAMEYMCRTLVTTFADKKTGFIFVHNIFGLDSELSVYWTEAKAKMIQALRKWGVPYIDLETEIPPLNCIASLKSEYTLNGDGWHPNIDGYKLLYCDKIESWMKTL